MTDRKQDEYAVRLPSPLDLIRIGRDEIHYTRKEREEAFATPEDKSTDRQKAIVRAVERRRAYRYFYERSPTPKWQRKIQIILTDLDNIEDIISTAAFATFAAGILIPAAAPLLLSISASLTAATIPLNIAEAALGLASGPLGTKRAAEALLDLIPGSKLMRIKKVPFIGKFANRLVKRSNVFREVAIRKLMRVETGLSREQLQNASDTQLHALLRTFNIDIMRAEGKMPFSKRLKEALPSWGQLLEAGQASETITGTGLVLGPIFGTATDMAWAGYRYVNGEKVKIYMPWEKPDEETRKASKAVRASARLLSEGVPLDYETQVKAIMSYTFGMKKLKEYWKGKDLDRYLPYILESDATWPETPSVASMDALGSYAEGHVFEEGSYVEVEEYETEDTFLRYEAESVQEEVQGILQHGESRFRKITAAHQAYLTGALMNLVQKDAARTILKVVGETEEEPETDLEPKYKVMIAMISRNILPMNFIDYRSGIPGVAFGHTIDWNRSEVIKNMKTAADDMVRIVQGKDFKRSTQSWLKKRYEMMRRTQRLTEDVAENYEIETGIPLNEKLDREEIVYSWYFDIWDYWLNQVNKLTILYKKGQIKLTTSDILKHIGFPEPALYDYRDGRYVRKKLDFVFNIDSAFATSGTKWATFWKLDDLYLDWLNKHPHLWTNIGIPDDLWRQYQPGGIVTKGLNLELVDTKEKNYNSVIQKTFEKIMIIGGWTAIPATKVLGLEPLTAEEEYMMKRLKGVTSPCWMISPFAGEEKDKDRWLRKIWPFTETFYAYNKPPVWILNDTELKLSQAYGTIPPPWYSSTILRRIFHVWIRTRPPDWEFQEVDLSLDNLKRMWRELFDRGIKVPDWPEETEKMLRATGRDGGPLRTGGILSLPPAPPKEILQETTTLPVSDIPVIRYPQPSGQTSHASVTTVRVPVTVPPTVTVRPQTKEIQRIAEISTTAAPMSTSQALIYANIALPQSRTVFSR